MYKNIGEVPVSLFLHKYPNLQSVSFCLRDNSGFTRVRSTVMRSRGSVGFDLVDLSLTPVAQAEWSLDALLDAIGVRWERVKKLGFYDPLKEHSNEDENDLVYRWLGMDSLSVIDQKLFGLSELSILANLTSYPILLKILAQTPSLRKLSVNIFAAEGTINDNFSSLAKLLPHLEQINLIESKWMASHCLITTLDNFTRYCPRLREVFLRVYGDKMVSLLEEEEFPHFFRRPSSSELSKPRYPKLVELCWTLQFHDCWRGTRITPLNMAYLPLYLFSRSTRFYLGAEYFSTRDMQDWDQEDKDDVTRLENFANVVQEVSRALRKEIEDQREVPSAPATIGWRCDGPIT